MLKVFYGSKINIFSYQFTFLKADRLEYFIEITKKSNITILYLNLAKVQY